MQKYSPCKLHRYSTLSRHAKGLPFSGGASAFEPPTSITREAQLRCIRESPNFVGYVINISGENSASSIARPFSEGYPFYSLLSLPFSLLHSIIEPIAIGTRTWFITPNIYYHRMPRHKNRIGERAPWGTWMTTWTKDKNGEGEEKWRTDAIRV